MRKQFKLFLCVILVLVMNNNLFTITGLAQVDTTKPVLKSISVDKTAVTAGQSVGITVEAADEEGGSGIKSADVYYSSPVTSKTKSIRLAQNADGKYIGQLAMTENDESGTWIIQRVVITDNTGNYNAIYNSKNKGTLTSWNQQDFSYCNFELSGTVVDTVKPELKSISINKTSVTAGQSVEVTVDAADEEGGSGIKSVDVYYSSPVTSKTKSIRLSQNADGKYIGQLAMTENDESGTWIIQRVVITDHTGNYNAIYNSKNKQTLTSWNQQDFSHCNFELSGTVVDTVKPELISISVEKPSVTAGQGVELTVEAADEEGGSGIESVVVYYSSPVTFKTKYVRLTKDTDEKYKGKLYMAHDDELGTWIVQRIVITDHTGNYNAIYNSKNEKTLTSWNQQDFSHCNFDLNENDSIINGSYVLTQNEYWTSHTFEGDVYIGPEAILTIDGPITVNGDIYVLGGLKNYGDLNVNGNIYATSFLWGTSDFKNGTVLMLGGNNHISGMNSSNQPIKNVPLSIENDQIIAVNGVITNIEGTTLPIMALSLEGNKVEINSDGSFKVASINIGEKDHITFEFTDIFGNRILEEYPVKVIDTISPTAEADVKGGLYVKGKEVELQMSEEGSIYYSVDGGDPFAEGMIYSGPLVIAQNANLKFGAKDKAGNLSPVYMEEYNFYSINEITDISNKVTGKAEAGTFFEVMFNNQVIGSREADSNGAIIIEIPVQQAGTKLKILATDRNGNKGEAIELAVQDVTPPGKPAVDKITDQSEQITGAAEKESEVIVKVKTNSWRGIVDEEGKFSINIPKQKAGTLIEVTVKDRAGNVSETLEVTVADETAPSEPTVNKVTDQSTAVTGLAESMAEVTVQIGSERWKGKATSEGKFTINIPKQKAGTIMGVTATDTAGNESSAVKVTVVDETPPAAPVVKGLTDLENAITGLAEQGSTVIAMGSGIELGHSITELNGQFTIVIEKQPAGSTIEVIAIDKAGNASAVAKVTITDEKPQIQKLVGKTRYTTAVEISQAGWDKSETVFLVNGWAIADGLTATPLASAKDAPILLTTKNSLPEETLAEIERLKAKNIVLIGGSGVISDQIKSNLLSKGHTVTRIGGKTRYDTSLLIAQELDKLIDVHTVYMAYGHGEPDALSIAAQSGQAKQPIILTEKNAVPAKTYSWLKGEGLNTSYFIGGKGVISPVIMDEVNKITSKNVLNNRLSGINRQETNAKVIEAFYLQSELPTIMVAHSHTAKLVDALAAGPLAAKYNVPVLLVSNQLDPSQLNAMAGKRANAVHQIGGGIDHSLLNDLVNLLN
ncbi:Ig-like domain-containing protein [Cytobacillus sp. NJ13]|nr:Ig-like domain-containing protein [Cytobacillus sp. NJ13]